MFVNEHVFHWMQTPFWKFEYMNLKFTQYFKKAITCRYYTSLFKKYYTDQDISDKQNYQSTWTGL